MKTKYHFYLKLIFAYMKKWDCTFTISEIKKTARLRYEQDHCTRYGWE